MESYRLLHTNQYGYVIQCQCCSKAQITFGSVIVTLSEEDFIFSKNYFTGLAGKYLDQLLIEPDKKIIIETILGDETVKRGYPAWWRIKSCPPCQII